MIHVSFLIYVTFWNLSELRNVLVTLKIVKKVITDLDSSKVPKIPLRFF